MLFLSFSSSPGSSADTKSKALIELMGSVQDLITSFISIQSPFVVSSIVNLTKLTTDLSAEIQTQSKIHESEISPHFKRILILAVMAAKKEQEAAEFRNSAENLMMQGLSYLSHACQAISDSADMRKISDAFFFSALSVDGGRCN